MLIKIPKVIKIGVHPYKIIFKPSLKIDDNCDGLVSHRKQIIALEPLQANSQRDVTFLHEITHIVNHIYSCHLDEEAIDRVSEGIAEFLFNNLGIEFDWDDIWQS